MKKLMLGLAIVAGLGSSALVSASETHFLGKEKCEKKCEKDGDKKCCKKGKKKCCKKSAEKETAEEAK